MGILGWDSVGPGIAVKTDKESDYNQHADGSKDNHALTKPPLQIVLKMPFCDFNMSRLHPPTETIQVWRRLRA